MSAGHGAVPRAAALDDAAAREQARGHADGMRVLSYLLAGPLCYGGIGWLVDHFVLDRVLLLPIGTVVGLALSIFMIIRRYGGSHEG